MNFTKELMEVINLEEMLMHLKCKNLVMLMNLILENVLLVVGSFLFIIFFFKKNLDR